MYTDKQNRNNFIFKTRRRIDDRSFQVQLALFPREIRRFRGLVTEDKSVAFGKSRGACTRAVEFKFPQGRGVSTFDTNSELD